MILQIIFWLIAISAGIFLLLKSSDLFVEKAEKTGLALKIPQFIVGATIVAFGTSMPELLTSVVANIRGSSEIVLANVIGSNIANILLIMGISVFLYHGIFLNVHKIKYDMAFYGIGIILLFIFMYNSAVGFMESVILTLSMIAISCFYIYLARKQPCDEEENTEKLNFKHWIVLILSCALLYAASEIVIKSLIELSVLLKISKTFIAVTLLAVGTSLPELVVSITSVKKKNTDILVGNLIGSCVFNIFSVVGISGLFGKIAVTPDIMYVGFYYMLVSFLLFAICAYFRKITLPIGGIFLALYGIFVFHSF